MNHVNEFIPVTKLMKKNEIPEKMKSYFTLSEALTKLKEINARNFPSVFGKSIESCIIERVHDIVLFQIEVNWFFTLLIFVEQWLRV